MDAGIYIKRCSSGFTLLEVMIVVLLLGIVLAVAVPSINYTLDEIKLDGAAQEVVSAIHFVQSLSIKEGVGYAVKFHDVQNRFWCYDSSTGIYILNPVDKKPYEIDFRQKGRLQGVDIISASFGVANKSSVIFNNLGEPSDSGTVTLGYAGSQKIITISTPIGRVTVQ